MTGAHRLTGLALALLPLLVSCQTSGIGAPDAATASPERLYPAPTSTLFTPAPFELPADGRSFWSALADVTARLRPTPPSDDPAGERARLQACDHLAQLADLVMSDDRRDYEITGAPLLEFQGVAFSCQNPATANTSFDRLVAVLKTSPYRTGAG